MNNSRLQIGGWILFSLSGAFFVISGIVNDDPWTVIGSITWLAGVALFLLSYRR